MHGFDEGQIVGRIDGEPAALARKGRIFRRARDRHEIGMELEIAGDMLARGCIVARIHHQLVERTARERIHALMRGDSTFLQQNIIAVLRDQMLHQMIDKARIDERRIGGHAHDDIGIEQFGGARKAGQHVILRPAHHGHIVGAAEFGDGVVARIGGRRNRDLLG